MNRDSHITFANIASGPFRKPPTDFTVDDFPALGTQQQQPSQTREEILMSNLLGSSNQQSSIGSSIMKPGNMEFSQQNDTFQNEFKRQDEFQQNATSTTNSLDSTKKENQNEKYGLLGLIDVIRMTNPDLSMLALGCELTSLGLDLQGGDKLYSQFVTPFSNTQPTVSEPNVELQSNTSSYSKFNNTISPPLSKIDCFTDETLFYMFYSNPRDMLQEAAAQELYKRNWRFHKEFKLWLTKDKENSEPIMKGPDFERGIYIFFDPSTWSRVKKEWVLYSDQLEERVSITYSQSVASDLDSTKDNDTTGLIDGMNQISLNHSTPSTSFARVLNNIQSITSGRNTEKISGSTPSS